MLIGLLLPAVQKVRAAAARTQCQNKLKQIALAAHSYHDAVGGLPPGVAYPGPGGRWTSLFVELLPYCEQGNVAARWDFATPTNNFGGDATVAATPLTLLLCPTSKAANNPVRFGSLTLGLTSYGGNAGFRAFPTSRCRNDGVFGYATATNRNQTQLVHVTDGTSNTLLFGEKLAADANLDTYLVATLQPPASPALQATGIFSAWACVPGPTAGAGLLLNTVLTVNFTFPEHYEPPALPAGTTAPPVPWGPLESLAWDRYGAFGSEHLGGAHFAMCDGSVRFLRTELPLAALQALGTRAGGETTPAD